MSLSRSFRILRRCLNTAASDSKTIGGGQSKSKSESITRAHSEAGSQSASDSKSNFNGHSESGSQSASDTGRITKAQSEAGSQSASDTEPITRAQSEAGSPCASDSKSNFNGHSESGLQFASDTEPITQAQSEAGSPCASDSKSNFDGHSESGSQSVNHGQKIPELLADHANALPPGILTVVQTSIAMGLGAVFAHLINESMDKEDLKETKRVLLEKLDRSSREYYAKNIEEVELREVILDQEIILAMEELKVLREGGGP